MPRKVKNVRISSYFTIFYKNDGEDAKFHFHDDSRWAKMTDSERSRKLVKVMNMFEEMNPHCEAEEIIGSAIKKEGIV